MTPGIGLSQFGPLMVYQYTNYFQIQTKFNSSLF